MKREEGIKKAKAFKSAKRSLEAMSSCPEVIKGEKIKT